MSVRSTVVLLVPPLLALGCTTPPTVHVGSVSRMAPESEGQQYHLILTLRNPGDSPLELETFSYSLYAGGRSYSGSWVASKTVPPFGTVDEQVPAVLLGAALADGTPWSVSGEISYLARNTLAHTLFDMGVERPQTAFSGGGTVPPATNAGQ